MLDLIKRSMELGLGAATVTQESLRQIADELVLKGNLSKKDGGDILKEFTRIAGDSQKKMKNLVEDQVRSTIKELGIATTGDLKKMEGKIAKLEAKLAKKKAKEKKK